MALALGKVARYDITIYYMSHLMQIVQLLIVLSHSLFQSDKIDFISGLRWFLTEKQEKSLKTLF